MELVVWVCDQAGQASRALQALKRRREPEARNAVVLVRNGDGHVYVYETGDLDRRYGTLPGILVGMFVALLGDPDSEVVVAQALSMGFSEEYLVALRASFRPGGSALVTLVETDRVEGILDLLASLQGHVLRHALEDDVLAQAASGILPQER
jgi:uncharacterized membrane protein